MAELDNLAVDGIIEATRIPIRWEAQLDEANNPLKSGTPFEVTISYGEDFTSGGSYLLNSYEITKDSSGIYHSLIQYSDASRNVIKPGVQYKISLGGYLPSNIRTQDTTNEITIQTPLKARYGSQPLSDSSGSSFTFTGDDLNEYKVHVFTDNDSISVPANPIDSVIQMFIVGPGGLGAGGQSINNNIVAGGGGGSGGFLTTINQSILPNSILNINVNSLNTKVNSSGFLHQALKGIDASGIPGAILTGDESGLRTGGNGSSDGVEPGTAGQDGIILTFGSNIYNICAGGGGGGSAKLIVAEMGGESVAFTSGGSGGGGGGSGGSGVAGVDSESNFGSGGGGGGGGFGAENGFDGGLGDDPGSGGKGGSGRFGGGGGGGGGGLSANGEFGYSRGAVFIVYRLIDIDQTPLIPQIISTTATVGNPNQITLVWAYTGPALSEEFPYDVKFYTGNVSGSSILSSYKIEKANVVDEGSNTYSTILTERDSSGNPFVTGQTYYFRLIARGANGADVSEPSDFQTVTFEAGQPSGPTNLIVDPASSISATKIPIQWQYDSSGFLSLSPTTPFEVNLCNSSGITQESYFLDSSGFRIDSSGYKADVKFRDSSGNPLIPSTTYYIALRAYDDTNYSDKSNLLEATTSAPPAPTNLANSDTPTTSNLTLTWTYTTNPDLFTIKYTTIDSSNNIDSSGSVNPTGNQRFYLMTGLQSGKQYTFTISATVSGVESVDSSSVVVATLPQAPSGLNKVSATATSITLSWTHTTSAQNFTVYYTNSSGNSPDSTTFAKEPNVNTKVITGLVPATSYIFTMRAFAYSRQSALSNSSEPLSTEPSSTTVPSTPEIIVATTQILEQVNSIYITWTYTGSPLASTGPFDIIFYSDSSGTTQIVTATPTVVNEGENTYSTSVTSDNFEGGSFVFESGITYYFSLQAVGEDYTTLSNPSAIQTVTFEPAPPTGPIPVPPTNLIVDPSSNISANQIPFQYQLDSSGALVDSSGIPFFPFGYLVPIRWDYDSSGFFLLSPTEPFQVNICDSSGIIESSFFINSSGFTIDSSGYHASINNPNNSFVSDTTYYITLRAHSNGGVFSDQSDLIQVTTNSARATNLIVDPAYSVSATEIPIQWQFDNALFFVFSLIYPVSIFEVNLCNSSGTIQESYRADSSGITVDSSGYHAKLQYRDSSNNPLLPATTYYIMLNTTLDPEIPFYSNLLEATTTSSSSGPAAPTNLLEYDTQTGITHKSIRLKWEYGTDPNSFTLNIVGSGTQTIPGNLREYLVESLRSATSYTFTITATIGGVESQPSDPLVSSTYDAPAPTITTSGVSVTPYTITVPWTYSEADESSIDGFKIIYGINGGSNTEITINDPNARLRTLTSLIPNTMYNIYVTAYIGGLQSNNQSDTIQASTTKYPTPGNFTEVGATTTSIDVSWTYDASNNPASFDIDVVDSSGSLGPISITAQGTDRNATLSQQGIIIPGIQYYIQIKAIDSLGSESDPTTAIQMATLPLAPTDLDEVNDTKTDTSITLQWSYESNAENFIVYYTNSSGDSSGSTDPFPKILPLVTKEITGLLPATSYIFTARAFANNKQSALSTPSDPIPTKPATPTNLAQTFATSNSLTTAWIYNYTDPDFFTINYTSLYSSGSVDASGNLEQIVITGLLPDTTYDVSITATVSGLESEPTTGVFFTAPAAPALQDLYSEGSLASGPNSISWNVPSGSNYTYKLYYTSSNSSGIIVGVTLEQESSYSFYILDDEFDLGRRYTFRLTATNDAGESDFSNSVTILMRPGNGTYFFNSPTSITVSCDTPNDYASVTIGYFAIINDIISTNFIEVGPIQNPPPYVVQLNDASGNYKDASGNSTFYLSGTDSSGLQSIYNEPITQVAGDITPVPTNLAEKSNTATPDSLTLTWAYATDPNLFTINYSSSDSSGSVDASGTLRERAINGLDSGKQYTFTISATVSGVESVNSSSVVIATLPEAPSGLSEEIQYRSPTSITLTWTHDSFAQNFTIYYTNSSGDSSGSTTFAKVDEYGTDITSRQITDLLPRTSYTFTMRAFAYSRQSALSDPQTISTQPYAPTNIQVVSRTADSLTISWIYSYPNPDSFDIMYYTSDGQAFQPLTTSGSARQIVITTLSPGTLYDIDVYARVSNINSESLSDSFATKPTAPTGLSDMSTVPLPENGSFTPAKVGFSWTPTAEPDGYTVYYEQGGNTGNVEENLIQFTNYDFSVSDFVLFPGTRYTFNVSVTENDVESDPSAPLTILTPPGNTATYFFNSPTSITVSYDTPNDYAGVSIWYYPQGDLGSIATQVGPILNGPPYVVELNSSGDYRDASGNSTFFLSGTDSSGLQSVFDGPITQVAGVLPPTPPTSLIVDPASSISATQIPIQWQYDSSGFLSLSPTTPFEVNLCNSSGVTQESYFLDSSGFRIDSSGYHADVKFRDSSGNPLLPSTTYYIALEAYDDINYSDKSNLLEATTTIGSSSGPTEPEFLSAITGEIQATRIPIQWSYSDIEFNTLGATPFQVNMYADSILQSQPTSSYFLNSYEVTAPDSSGFCKALIQYADASRNPLLANTQYFFDLKAYNGTSFSDKESERIDPTTVYYSDKQTTSFTTDSSGSESFTYLDSSGIIYKVHKFTQSGILTIPANPTASVVEMWIVGPGGNGGNGGLWGSGGGAGGELIMTNQAILPNDDIEIEIDSSRTWVSCEHTHWPNSSGYVAYKGMDASGSIAGSGWDASGNTSGGNNGGTPGNGITLNFGTGHIYSVSAGGSNGTNQTTTNAGGGIGGGQGASNGSGNNATALGGGGSGGSRGNIGGSGTLGGGGGGGGGCENDDGACTSGSTGAGGSGGLGCVFIRYRSTAPVEVVVIKEETTSSSIRLTSSNITESQFTTTDPPLLTINMRSGSTYSEPTNIWQFPIIFSFIDASDNCIFNIDASNTTIIEPLDRYWMFLNLNADGSILSDPSDIVNVVTAPANFTYNSSGVTTDTIPLSWSNSSGNATAFNIYYSSTDSSGSITNLSGTSYNLAGLESGTEYTIRLAGIVYGEESAPSKLTVTTAQGSVFVPVAPTNLADVPNTATIDSLTVSWEYSQGDEANIDGFTIYFRTAGEEYPYQGIDPPTEPFNRQQTIISELTEGTQYDFYIVAVKNNVNSSGSNVLTIATKPGAPASFTNIGVDYVGNFINWEAPPDGYEPYTYRLYYTSSNSSGTIENVTLAVYPGGAAPTYNLDDEFELGRRYTISVTATKNDRESDQSDPLTILMSPGNGKFFFNSPTSITVSWDIPNDYESLSFRPIIPPGDGDVMIIPIPSSSPPYNIDLTTLGDYEPDASGNYNFSLSGTDSSGLSSFYSQQLIEVPAPPTGLIVDPASSISATQIPIQWQYDSSGFLSLSPTTPFQVNLCNSSGITQQSYFLDSSGFRIDSSGYHADVKFRDSSGNPLLPSTTYYIALRAYDDVNYSDQSNLLQATTSATSGPVAPTALAEVPNTATTNALTLTWAYGTNPNLFTINYTTNDSSGSIDASGTLRERAITGLQPAKQYTFTISATVSGVKSVNSSNLVIATLPEAPSGLNRVSATTTSIRLGWTHNSFAQNFTVYYTNSSGDSSGSTTFAKEPNVSNKVISDLLSGTSYRFTMRAFAYSRESALSSEVTISTNSSTSTIIAPTNLAEVPNTATIDSLTVSWEYDSSNNSSIDGFKLSYVGYAFSETVELSSVTREYPVSGLGVGREYTFNIVAYKDSSNSDIEGPLITATFPDPPQTPSDISVGGQLGTAENILEWNSSVGPADTFILYYESSDSSGAIQNIIANENNIATTYNLNNEPTVFLLGKKYIFRASSVISDSSGINYIRESAQSDAGILLMRPGNGRYYFNSPSSITVSCDTPNDYDSVSIAYYNVDAPNDLIMVPSNGFPPYIIDVQGTGNYIDASGNSTFYLKGLNDIGIESVYSDAITLVPAPPTSLIVDTASSISATQIPIQWQYDSSGFLSLSPTTPFEVNLCNSSGITQQSYFLDSSGFRIDSNGYYADIKFRDSSGNPLLPSTTYYIALRAYDDVNYSDQSSLLEATTIGSSLVIVAPTNFAEVTDTATTTRLEVEWEYLQADEANIDGFKITYSNGNEDIVAETENTSVRQNEMNNLAPGTLYSVTIVAYKDSSNSDVVGPLSIATLPEAPSDIVDNSLGGIDGTSGNQIAINIPDIENVPETFTLYYQGADSSGFIANIPGNLYGESDIALSNYGDVIIPGKKYTFRATAVKNGRESAQSPPLTILMRPGNGRYYFNSPTSITVSCDTPNDYDSVSIGYYDVDIMSLIQIGPIQNPPPYIIDLEETGNYIDASGNSTFYILGIDSSGFESVYSDAITLVPPPPTGLMLDPAYSLTLSQIPILWQYDSSGFLSLSPTTPFTFVIYDSNNTTPDTYEVDSTGITQDSSGYHAIVDYEALSGSPLLPETTYFIALRGYNGTNFSDNSNIVEFTSPSLILPDPPTNLIVDPASEILAWKIPILWQYDSSGFLLLSSTEPFQVNLCNSGGTIQQSYFLNPSEITIDSSGYHADVEYRNSSQQPLLPNTTYYITVRAHDGTNFSVQSNLLQARTANTNNAICFLKGTKILSLTKDFKEQYIEIEKIRPGMIVKTLNKSYVKVQLIGKMMFENPDHNKRCLKRLYRLPKRNYPELKEDLIITGNHSILVDTLSKEEEKMTLDICKRIYITTDKYRLMAHIDQRAEPYVNPGLHEVWHLALENENYICNYGVYANGLPAETCSLRMILEYSGMELCR